jgi:hypothetical protein
MQGELLDQPDIDARVFVPALKRPESLRAAGPELASSKPHGEEPGELAEVIRRSLRAALPEYGSLPLAARAFQIT